MAKIPRGVFTEEFKEEAVKMVIDAGLSIPEVSRRLSLPKSTLARRVALARKSGLVVKRGPATEGRWKLRGLNVK